MGQKHNINPHQLTMFERAGDLADHEKFYPNDAFYASTVQADADAAHWGATNYPLDWSADEIREDVRQEKLTEAKWDSDLYESVAENGIKSPVEIGGLDEKRSQTVKEYTGVKPSRGILYNGHHRVYSQEEINPDAWVPVTWNE